MHTLKQWQSCHSINCYASALVSQYVDSTWVSSYNYIVSGHHIWFLYTFLVFYSIPLKQIKRFPVILYRWFINCLIIKTSCDKYNYCSWHKTIIFNTRKHPEIVIQYYGNYYYLNNWIRPAEQSQSNLSSIVINKLCSVLFCSVLFCNYTNVENWCKI